MISQSAATPSARLHTALWTRGRERDYAFLSPCDRQEDAVKRIEESPIKMLVTTDTVDNTDVLKKFKKKIKVVSAAPLFAEAVRTILEREPAWHT